MSISALSSQQPRQIEPHLLQQMISDKLKGSNIDSGNSMIGMAIKTATLVLCALGSIAGFMLGGPIIGAAVAVGAGIISLFTLFSLCPENPHHHQPPPQGGTTPVYIPWYQRVIEYIPIFIPTSSGGGHVSVGSRSHVPPDSGRGRHIGVGRGHDPRGGQPHVAVGGGHDPRDSQPHVGVGGGHDPRGSQPHVGVGRGHDPRGGQPHVGVGGGRAGRGTPPDNRDPASRTPPPSGPGGHVGIGSGRGRS